MRISLIILAIFTSYVVIPNKVEASKVNYLSYQNTLKVELDSTVHLADSIIFEEAVEHLKEYEGYSSKVYIDVDGSRTIGYGHHLLGGETYTEITEEVATELLREDLSTRVDKIRAKYDLKYNQALALGLFAYNIGMGGLNKAISKGLLTKIDKLLLYCNYTTTVEGEKVKVRSKKLRERREYELNLYLS